MIGTEISVVQFNNQQGLSMLVSLLFFFFSSLSLSLSLSLKCVGESKYSEGFSCKFCFGCTVFVRVCRNLWRSGLSALKIRVIVWKNDVTVQAQMILYCFKTIYSGCFLTALRIFHYYIRGLQYGLCSDCICYRFPLNVGLLPVPENGLLNYCAETCRILQAVKEFV
jgi:hypothetical protein